MPDQQHLHRIEFNARELSRLHKMRALRAEHSNPRNSRRSGNRHLGFLSLLLVAVARCADYNADGQALVNGDFEDPGWVRKESQPATQVYLDTGSDGQNEIHRGYTYFWVSLPGGSKYLPGWLVGGAGVYHNVNNLPWYNVATKGNHGLTLYRYYGPADYRGGSIAQTINDLEADETYYLSLDLYQPSLGPETAVTVTIAGKSTVLLNAVFATWQTHTIPFRATASKASLSIAAPTRTVPGVMLDNVRVSTNANVSVALQSKRVTGIQVSGELGKTYRVEWANSLDAATWIFLERLKLTNAPTWIYDEVVMSEDKRFYRSVEE